MPLFKVPGVLLPPNNMKNPSVSVIVSTYNNIPDLNLVIEGYRTQTDLDFTLYIADDGSTSETANFIQEKAKQFPVPIKHIWHEDQGFQLSAIRNRAIVEAQSSYLIITDGDCIPLPNMIQAHRSYATLGCFVTGGRLLLSKKLSQTLRLQPWAIQCESNFSFVKRVLQKDINRITPIILPVFLSKPNTQLHGIRGCHLAFWREDLMRIKGFDEIYQGWGREDSDIAARLFHLGVSRRNLRGLPLLHLWHEEANRAQLNHNDQLLHECLRDKKINAIQGIKESYE